MNDTKSKQLWLLCRLDDTIYAISCDQIQSLEILKEVTKIPKAPQCVRGVINLRGKVIHIIDARKMMGMKSTIEEVNEIGDLLNKRKEDHINWLSTLEKSVKERIKFTLTTNPHECAFGKWYDSFETNNLVLKHFIKKFDEPHKKIHSIALDVKRLEEEGNFTGANLLIQNTKENELGKMIELFSTLIDTYLESLREIVIVLKNNEKTIGVIVDEAISIEPLIIDNEVTSHSEIIDKNLSLGVGKRKKESSLAIILNNERFFNL